MRKLKKILNMEIPKSEFLNLALSLFPMLFGVFLYSFISVLSPDYVKIENIDFITKLISMLIIIPIPLIINLLLLGTPKIDPLYKNYQKFEHTYEVFRTVVIIFFDLLIIGTFVMMLGVMIPIILYTFVSIGCLFVLMGAVLRDTKQNYFFGIRTPWTLMDDKNWYHTNFLAGNLFIVLGSLLVIMGLFSPPLWLAITLAVLVVLALSIIPFIYSYNYYQKQSRPK